MPQTQSEGIEGIELGDLKVRLHQDKVKTGMVPPYIYIYMIIYACISICIIM